ncbi:hypothetical protein MLD38_002492 [Melastoma candidum]|uniref:Uncharacterized protein n=1 Tax=Melastoma candidum TaxID=119954 RepID=A0ACB9S2K9_9MYRT|nr:hypothetical protein MLD38_002492 [Melastoma candidum]
MVQFRWEQGNNPEGKAAGRKADKDLVNPINPSCPQSWSTSPNPAQQSSAATSLSCEAAVYTPKYRRDEVNIRRAEQDNFDAQITDDLLNVLVKRK